MAYRDLGRGYFDLNRERLTRHHIRCLAELGVAIAIAPVPIPAELSGDPLVNAVKPVASFQLATIPSGRIALPILTQV